VDSRAVRQKAQAMTCLDAIHWLCMRKSRSHFDLGFPQRNPQGAMTCLWKTSAGRPSAEVFPRSRTCTACCSRAGRTHKAAGKKDRLKPRERAAPEIQAGYHSPVCSSTEDAINRVAAAIDQLASDSRDAKGGVSEGELTTRIAALWQMVSDLDPELARRTRKYTGLADGDPSA
jgi:hypothetical protein